MSEERRVLHISPAPLQGGWRVETIGNGEAEVFPTREEAEARAHELAAELSDDVEVQVVAHDERGAIDEEWKA
jgi:hypothetical protein